MNTHQDIPTPSAARKLADELATSFDAAYIWSRPGLARADRHLAALSGAMALGNADYLMKEISAALKEGIAPLTIAETLIHNCLYSGTATLEMALGLAFDLFEAHGLTVSLDPFPTGTNQDMKAAGAALKATLHAERQNNGHANPDTRFASALYDLATDFGYGHIWQRPGLDLRQRLVCAVAAFTALPDCEDSLSKFAQTANNHGLSVTEIQEVAIQATTQIGFPRALKALMVLEDVL
ncbi:MAG: carboxymuconolactone decarboxylase family protein [Pseudomonadota bacterium]